MSWLPQRWRTQRNAIRHANCKIQWVIKILNATCTSFGEYVCWSVCSSPRFCILWWNRKYASVLMDVTIYFIPRWNKHFCRLSYLFWRYYTRRDVQSSSELSTRVYVYNIFIPKEKNHVYDNPIGPPIRQEYPLNLSILLSGGKETNKDSVSNCEWSRKSSDWKSSEL